MNYLDSEIIVKLYTQEPDSERWRILLRPPADVVTSVLSLTEVKSALRQKQAAGYLHPGRTRQIWSQFQADVQGGSIQALPLGSSVVEESIRLLDKLPRKLNLRALDALHIATLIQIPQAVLVTTDQRMIAAARALTIRTL